MSGVELIGKPFSLTYVRIYPVRMTHWVSPWRWRRSRLSASSSPRSARSSRGASSGTWARCSVYWRTRSWRRPSSAFSSSPGPCRARWWTSARRAACSRPATRSWRGSPPPSRSSISSVVATRTRRPRACSTRSARCSSLRTSRWRSRSPRAACTSGTTAETCRRGRRGGRKPGAAWHFRVGPRVARVRIGETRVMGGGRREGRGHARLVAGGEPGGGGEEAPCRADGRARGDAIKAREASAADDSPFTLSYVKVAMIYTTIIILYTL